MTKVTRTQQKYFEGYAEDLIRSALTVATPEADAEAVMSLIDIKDYAQRLAEHTLSKCSFSDIKAADRAYSDERVIRASLAIEDAIANTLPSTDDLKSVLFMAETMTKLHAGTKLLDAMADANDEVQAQVIKTLIEAPKA